MQTHFSILGIFYFWPSWSQLLGVVKSESIEYEESESDSGQVASLAWVDSQRKERKCLLEGLPGCM